MHPSGHLKNLVGPEVRPCQHVLATFYHIGVARIIDHHRIQPTDIESGLTCGSHGEQERPFDQTVKKGANNANRLATMVKSGRQVGPAVAELFGDLFDLGTRWYEDRHTAALTHDTLYETIVQELEGLLRHDIDQSSLGGIKRPRLQNLSGIEILRVETRIHGRRKPDEAAVRTLPQGQAQLHFGGGLVNFVDDERVLRGDETILEPAAGDSGRDDDDVPGRCLGGRFTLAIDDPDFQRCLENCFGHAADRERLAGACPRDNAEPLARSSKTANIVAVLALEQRLKVQAEGQLDGLAGGPCRGDDDDSPGRRLGCEECLRVGGEEMIAGYAHYWNI